MKWLSAHIEKIRSFLTRQKSAVEILEERRRHIRNMIDEIYFEEDHTLFYNSKLFAPGLYVDSFPYDLFREIRHSFLTGVAAMLDKTITQLKRLIIRIIIRINYPGRNIRYYIRQLIHFFFKNLDDSHIDFFYYNYSNAVK